jgi:hypothetical protein
MNGWPDNNLRGVFFDKKKASEFRDLLERNLETHPELNYAFYKNTFSIPLLKRKSVKNFLEMTRYNKELTDSEMGYWNPRITNITSLEESLRVDYLSKLKSYLKKNKPQKIMQRYQFLYDIDKAKYPISFVRRIKN